MIIRKPPHGEMLVRVQYLAPKMIICNICTEKIEENDEEYLDPDDNKVCESCFKKLFYKCAYCEEVGNLIDGYSSENDMYCEDCFNEKFFYCSRCDEAYSIDYTHTDPNGNLICEHCFDEDCFYCNGCETIQWLDDSYYCEDDDMELCSDCFHGDHAHCHECSEAHKKTNMFHNDIEGLWYCASCVATATDKWKIFMKIYKNFMELEQNKLFEFNRASNWYYSLKIKLELICPCSGHSCNDCSFSIDGRTCEENPIYQDIKEWIPSRNARLWYILSLADLIWNKFTNKEKDEYFALKKALEEKKK